MSNFLTEIDFSVALLFFLYAETHYSFRGIYSRLKKKEPEIIADVPHRVGPGTSIPVLILIKDADKYPLRLDSVKIRLGCKELRQDFEFEFDFTLINDSFWHDVLEVNPGVGFQGDCSVNVCIQVQLNGKKRVFKNDNYTCTSHAPFDVLVSEKKLPKSEGWYFGEFHCHTSYTSDQVEFGAPLDASVQLAKAMGLSFYCATDHSYDLDDLPDNYVKKDPDLTKWVNLQAEVKKLNEAHADFVIVPGEEISAGNLKRRNVHFLLLNHKEYMPGDGDSAEKWFRTRPNLTIAQILNKLNSTSVSFAAHPAVKPPFLEWLLVRRGQWEWQDCNHPNLDGLQIWNGTEDGLQKGKELWIRLLLQGKRVFISGGNDAHGNFNRFRQIGLPFLTMREDRSHLFGQVRTGVYLEQPLSLAALLTAFKHGRMIVTNGPFVELQITNEMAQTARVGDAMAGRRFTIDLQCRSSPEFGKLHRLRIYHGDLIAKQENLIRSVKHFVSPDRHQEHLDVGEPTIPGYIRAELFSEREGRILRCFTNPIWINYGA